MAWRSRLCRYHAVGWLTPGLRPGSTAETDCLGSLVIMGMARNHTTSASLVCAITVPAVTDQRRLHRVQPSLRPHR